MISQDEIKRKVAEEIDVGEFNLWGLVLSIGKNQLNAKPYKVLGLHDMIRRFDIYFPNPEVPNINDRFLGQ